MIRLLVTADDRTGALETAGVCADRGVSPTLAGSSLGLWMFPSELVVTYAVVVIDIASRHVTSADAGRRARASRIFEADHFAHKIDSTLRGNWAAELVAVQQATSGRVLVVPSFPDAGRRCVGGVVYDGGLPVADGAAGRDPRTPVRSSRPAEHLLEAGATSIGECRNVEDLAAWLIGSQQPFAVCDAASHDDLDAIGTVWADHPQVLFAGTAAAIASAAAACVSRREAPSQQTDAATRTALATGPTLVICGSLHAVARDQISALVDHGALVVHAKHDSTDLSALDEILTSPDGIGIVLSGAPGTEWIANESAGAEAARLGRLAGELLHKHDLGCLVLVGGDTAEAVLGDQLVTLHGTVDTGVPIGSFLDRQRPLVITKAGGFGGRHTLIDLLRRSGVDDR